MSLRLIPQRLCYIHPTQLHINPISTRRYLNLPSHLHDLIIMHAKATTSDGTVIAETDQYEFVEGNVYFPSSSIVNKSETFTDSSKHATCPWKGESSYYNVNVGGKTLENAAWYYPHPSEKAKHIKDHVAFGRCHRIAQGEGGSLQLTEDR
jgi:uncharacterized protein (DUF427 family)